MSTAVATVAEIPPQRLPTLAAGGSVKAIVPQDFEGAWRIASAVCKAGMAPRGLETAEKAMVAIMHGLEVGLTPMNALQSIAVVNGRPTIWGDGAIGLVRGSGLLEWMEETVTGEGDKMVATCTVKRKGEPQPTKGEFSAADAKTAGLWNKQGPWQQYPKRMLKMRARAFTLRDGFADVLKGLSIKEEVEDFHETAAPADEPPAPPPPPATVIEHQPAAAEKQDEPLPAAASQPVNLLAWIEGQCSAAKDADDLNTIWNDKIEPRVEDLFPPDQEEALGIFRKHERRFEQ